MLKLLCSMALCCINFITASAQISTVKTMVVDGYVSLQVPTIFQQISNPEVIHFLNSASYTPNWGIISENDQQQLLYSFTQQQSNDNDIPAAFDTLYKELQSSYKRLKILDDGIHLTDNRNVGYIVFSGLLNSDKKNGYLFYLSVQNRLLVFAFLSDKKLDKEWKSTLDKIAKSVTVAE